MINRYLALAAAAVLPAPYGGAHGQAPAANPLGLVPHHSTILVADLDRESGWYQRMLGFQEASRERIGPERVVSRLVIAGYRIDVVADAAAARNGNGSLPRAGWSNVVFEAPSLDELGRRLAAEGIVAKTDRDPQGQIVRLAFNDPEGNEIAVRRK